MICELVRIERRVVNPLISTRRVGWSRQLLMRMIPSVLRSGFVGEHFVVSHVIGINIVAIRTADDGRAHAQIAGQCRDCDINHVIAEATAVSPAGRISPGDAGIWSDQHLEPLRRSLLGWLLGQRDRRIAGAASILMQAVGSLFLAFGSGIAPLAAGCILFGLGVGNLVSLPPLIAQREFRPADVGTVVALVIAINQAVFAFGPVIFGWLHDFTASYVAPFLVAAGAQVAAAAVLAWGRRFR